MTKTLDHSVFDRPDCPKWARSAAVDRHGQASYWRCKSWALYPDSNLGIWVCVYADSFNNSRPKMGGLGYDATDWQNSAIDRDI